MVRGLGIADQAKEDDCDPCRHAPGRNSVTLPQTYRHAYHQRILRRTNCHTFQTTGALGRANLDEFVDREDRGTRIGTLRAIDAGVWVARYPGWTEQGGESEEAP